ncbi:MAG: GNAT family N-acetyltransferase [Acidobacteria bacterium]|nr:GNAT family N-acetyltransferase [Acidobacteriota bacterium]
MEIRRLTANDTSIAAKLFTVMASVFEEPSEPLPADYIQNLLTNDSFWALAAFDNNQIVGSLTAHTLPLTRLPVEEVFLYDIAVLPSHQRRGIGSQLDQILRTLAHRRTVFVAADNEDSHALDFYHHIDGEPAHVTIFTFN